MLKGRRSDGQAGGAHDRERRKVRIMHVEWQHRKETAAFETDRTR